MRKQVLALRKTDQPGGYAGVRNWRRYHARGGTPFVYSIINPDRYLHAHARRRAAAA